MVLSHSANFVFCSNSDERIVGQACKFKEDDIKKWEAGLGIGRMVPGDPMNEKKVSEKMVMSLKLLVTDRISH